MVKYVWGAAFLVWKEPIGTANFGSGKYRSCLSKEWGDLALVLHLERHAMHYLCSFGSVPTAKIRLLKLNLSTLLSRVLLAYDE